MKKITFLCAVTLAATALQTGCSVLAVGEEKFTCELDEVRNNPDTKPIACSGVKNVYNATSRVDRLPDPLQEKSKASDAPKADAATVPATLAVISVPTPITAPKPMIEPAQVARIWVNYWIDSKGDLHQPGLIYTEITPRRWAIGQPALAGAKDLQPYQTISASTEAGAPINISAPSNPAAAILSGANPLQPRR